MKKALAGAGLLLLVATGCNNLDTPEVRGLNTNPADFGDTYVAGEKDWQESLFGPGPANYGVAGKNNADRVDNISEINSTGASYRSPTAPHPTLADYQDAMETAIYEMANVTPGMVIIMGGDVWVNIMYDDAVNVTEDENRRRIEEVERRLYEVNPRYNYRIIVNDWR
ncbi:MAG: hypothetical protein LRY73_14390 [Bacillus sp. (in: Bacteria)]|nr:hypothetical protein [Bacillus sp. (in: firmicutes)]